MLFLRKKAKKLPPVFVWAQRRPGFPGTPHPAWTRSSAERWKCGSTFLEYAGKKKLRWRGRSESLQSSSVMHGPSRFAAECFLLDCALENLAFCIPLFANYPHDGTPACFGTPLAFNIFKYWQMDRCLLLLSESWEHNAKLIIILLRKGIAS